MSGFSTVEEALDALRTGRMVVVVDDERRENEGDLVMAGEKIRPEDVNFLSKEARGLVCVALTEDRARALNLSPMVDRNTAPFGTAFTVSVDYVKGTSTGISAFDRAATIRALADPATPAEDLARPGHIFPLVARQGGVIRRAGHTEAAVDLARLAGLSPVGVLCEIMDDDGHMARLPRLESFARDHDLRLLTIEELIRYRRARENLVTKLLEIDLPTRHGNFRLHLYESIYEGDHHMALVRGEVRGQERILVRVHSQCLTGDVFGSLRCDCGPQLDHAMRLISKEGLGVVLYMRQEGRSIGLVNKLKAYRLQEQGLDTVEANLSLGFKADLRDYGIGAQILADLGLSTIRLITNNPRKVVGLEGHGLEVVERVPLEVRPNPINEQYLAAKRSKLGHLFGLGPSLDADAPEDVISECMRDERSPWHRKETP
ncbi:bifunctional 3,4-dihydroxy-2-butanone-4-phosphate synthase/GTP cyclohydrolase II [Candidatus Fermentibacteria bacterium]|nr:bifunctional 3,4-dihydroxy-2-butanone-4-phosphate synthase/GTP cyclohydrolase II [Candidatus Fermentibacteria bacterium]